MKARLFCTTGPFAGSNFEFSKEATIGKGKGNSIVLASQIISNRHVRIIFEDASRCYILEDLGSRNGTQVDGVRVNKKERLSALSIVTFAQKFDFIFQAIDNYERESNEKKVARRETTVAVTPKGKTRQTTMTPVRAKDETAETLPANGKIRSRTMLAAVSTPVRVVPVEKAAPNRNSKTLVEAMALGKKIAASQSVFFLEVSSKGRRLKTFQLKKGENFLGRSSQCEIEIDDPSISRRHAVLTVNSGKIFLKDLGSRNHTFIGKQTIAAEMEIRLDTTLRFGNVEAQLIRKVGERFKASGIGHLA